MTHSTLIAPSDRKRAIEKLSKLGYKVRADANMRYVAKVVAEHRHLNFPRNPTEQGQLIQRFLEGTEAPRTALEPMKPLRMSRAEQIAMERVREAQNVVGFTEKMKHGA